MMSGLKLQFWTVLEIIRSEDYSVLNEHFMS